VATKKKNVRTKKATAAYVAKMATIRERRENWLKTLESGQYRQAEGQLRANVGKSYRYCCLGVLCNLEKEKGQKWDGDTFIVTQKIQDDFLGDYIDNETFYDMPPESITKKLNLSYELAGQLASMNDNGSSFKEIAAFLRKKWRMPKA
jgi:hypothetical protein